MGHAAASQHPLTTRLAPDAQSHQVFVVVIVVGICHLCPSVCISSHVQIKAHAPARPHFQRSRLRRRSSWSGNVFIWTLISARSVSTLPSKESGSNVIGFGPMGACCLRWEAVGVH